MNDIMPAAPETPAYAVERLTSLAWCREDDLAIVREALDRTQSLRARRDLIVAGSSVPEPLMIVDGWAHRSCLLADGRRQIIQLIVPGDVIHRLPKGCSQPHNITALTDVTFCTLSDARPSADAVGLEEALAVSRALQGDYLYRQITRLGRMSALERVVDWLLEMCDRLDAGGQRVGNAFPLPLTQETIADVLGLTSVHVNRTLMSLRRDKLIRVGNGRVEIVDRARCELLVGAQR